MELKLGNFHVRDVQFGEKTIFANGVLTISKEEALSVILADKRITKCDLVIARPGDSVRFIPVKTSIEARSKVSGKKYAYPSPGSEQDVEMGGYGVTHCLKGLNILTVGKYAAFADGILDMCGPAANNTHFSHLLNLGIIIESTDNEEEAARTAKRDEAHKLASFRMAGYLGETVRSMEPEDWETYSFEPILKRNNPELLNLPKVAYVLIVSSNAINPGYNTTVYGQDSNHMLPIFVNPLEIMDGALGMPTMTCAVYGENSYNYVNNGILKRLMAEHGKTLNFIGAILTNCNVTLDEKKRSAAMLIQLCKNLGLDAVIHTLPVGGNPMLDFMMGMTGYKDAGIKAVGLTIENSGKDGKSQPLINLDNRAEAVVACGNAAALIELPPMQKVYGDVDTIIRDPWSGAWARNDELGPSLRSDGSILVEMYCVWGGSSCYSELGKSVREF